MESQLLNIGVDITLFGVIEQSINITIKPFSGVRVSVPHISFNKAKEVANRN